MRNKINNYINIWMRRDYYDGIPDEAPDILELLNKVPSYRHICRAILKNDVQLESLGYTRQKCEMYMYLKKIELENKGKIKKSDNQLLFKWS